MLTAAMQVRSHHLVELVLRKRDLHWERREERGQPNRPEERCHIDVGLFEYRRVAHLHRDVAHASWQRVLGAEARPVHLRDRA